MNDISKKKLHFNIQSELRKYLKRYSRELNLPVGYADLDHYENSVSLYDKAGRDTLWETVV